jgi:hypothetical protein
MTKRVAKVEKEGLTEEQPEAVPADELFSYVLQKPIKSYGKEVRVIKMRRPTGHDLMAVGNPVVFYPYTTPIKIEHDLPKVLNMVARISEPPIPSGSLADMDPNDILGIAWAISPFFTPAR